MFSFSYFCFSVWFGLENQQVRNRRPTGKIGEILEFVAVQPPGISSSRLQPDFHDTGALVGQIVRRADAFRR